MALTVRSWLPRWAPTSDLELYQAESAILNPIRPMISQRMVAGLNTICSIHEKVAAVSERPPLMSVTGIAEGASSESAVKEAFDQYGAQSVSHPLPIPPLEGYPSDFTPKPADVLKPLPVDDYNAIIAVHGFCGGVANWLPVWKAFAKENDLYAFDLPGFARSERPHKAPFTDPRDALLFFMDYFEAWYEAMGFGVVDTTLTKGQKDALVKAREASRAANGGRQGRRIVLMGHSFGGYLCAQFAIKHPHLVDRVILADAWGLKRPDLNESAKRRAKLVGLKAAVLDYACDGLPWGWILRSLGPIAPWLLPKARPEFTDAWRPHLDDPLHFYDYTYHSNARLNTVGEAAVTAMRLAPLSCRLPLYDRREEFPSSVKWNILYGARSWMTSDDALAMVELFKSKGFGTITYGLIPNAGHQIAVDNAAGFVSEVLSLLANS